MQLRHIALALLSITAIANPASGVYPENLDTTVRIQDDLFRAVNGGWEKRADIPADRSSWGATGELRNQSESHVREIVEQAAQSADTDPTARQIATFYQSFMDEATIEALGLKPLQPLLDRVAAVETRGDLVREMGALQVFGVNMPLMLDTEIDGRDSRHYLLQVWQDGLGMPSRDYYLQDDAAMKKARTAYLDYLQTLFVLAGSEPADAANKAQAVIGLETRLARAQWTKEDEYDPIKTYNKHSLATLARAVPGFDWSVLLTSAAVPNVEAVNLGQPSYAKAVGRLMASEPVAVWRDYQTARLLDHFAPALPKAFVEAHFRFHSQTLTGATEMRPRWKRGVAMVEQNLGMAVGRLYVAKYFPPETKAKIDTLVQNLLVAFEKSIAELSWMSPTTKAAAQQKLSKYAVKVGYPEKWRDYSGLEVKAGDALGNQLRGAAFQHHYQMSKLNQPVDRTEWGMTPQTVNAYYNPGMNEIVFPAAYLQPPYFDPNVDDAANYGNVGATIGHEISHGFDNSGAQYDGDGNLRMWWGKQDKAAFDKLTAQLVKDFNDLEALPGRYVNGKLTLGENIADLSGLQVAYKAYQLSLNGKEAPVIDGYTGDQRFFIGYASSWREKMRKEMLLQLLVSDPHAPDHFRANQPALNTDAYHAAFGTKAGDSMFRPAGKRIRIW
ncbi:M13 family metallopeptidase [Chitinimonas sp. BJB300]|uniref:M13 family metallopeptidase n=1 Tax=Chitinimonas sp. BJB300 TaxID=1559339 RepID=UPI000C0C79A0|nr:M13 family metallopeptidase [Chitinimonas sp. BJB300]PHV11227.1 peptidase M13 [Chitinimonas sp. BJB300]TSJ87386.1 M13 family metallopeptidase [Chitinimonas sp. BJB300]